MKPTNRNATDTTTKKQNYAKIMPTQKKFKHCLAAKTHTNLLMSHEHISANMYSRLTEWYTLRNSVTNIHAFLNSAHYNILCELGTCTF